MDSYENDVIYVSLVVVPDATLGTVTGLYEALKVYPALIPEGPRFLPEIVAPSHHLLRTSCGLPFRAHKTVAQVEHSDIVILPSLLLEGGKWQTGRYPGLVDWLKEQYRQGAILCSACSGVLILAETGLLDGLDATLHWAYKQTFSDNFPRVGLRLEDVLVISGAEQRFVMSGASASWHDLLMYLISRYCGPHAAQLIGKFFLLQWHTEGQAPYMIFQEQENHGDGVVLQAQQWMKTHIDADNPIESVVKQSGLPERSFNRRFKKATGFAPIAYMQSLRIEVAKRHLEDSDTPVDDISYGIGYDEPAFFRRLFKRITGLTPSAYRRKFRAPLVTGKH
jgi:transcriptional regulator GlxA family with amidase domain